MSALKRAISLFLAGITALTMMCAGTISAGAAQTSECKVTVSKKFDSTVITLNIPVNDVKSALKQRDEVRKNNPYSRIDIRADIEFISPQSDRSYLFVISFFEGKYYYPSPILFNGITYEEILNPEQNPGFSCAMNNIDDVTSFLSADSFAIQVVIPKQYSKSIETISKCTKVSAVFGLGIDDGQTYNLFDSNGGNWKSSSVSCDFSGLKTTASEKNHNTKQEKIIYKSTRKGAYYDYEAFYVKIKSNIDRDIHLASAFEEVEKNVYVLNPKVDHLYIIEDIEPDDLITVKFHTKNGKEYIGNVGISSNMTNGLDITDFKTKSGKTMKEIINNFNLQLNSYGIEIPFWNIDAIYACEPKNLNADDITEVEFIIERGKNSVSPQNNPPKKTTLTVKKTDEKYTFSWGKVSGVDKYQIYYSTDGKNYTKLANISGKKTSYSTAKLDESKTYSFKIRSYKKVDGKTYYSKFSKVVKK